MTINDIKKATLALMFANYADDLRDENVDEFTDPQYTKYTVNMDASINRALARIEAARVLPLASVTLTSENGTGDSWRRRWNLSSLASDFMAVSRVIREGAWGYESSVHYEMEGNTVVLPFLAEDEDYRVLYHRRVARIALAAPSSTVVDVPDYVADIIPYWVKADLYEEDEANMAVAARNTFEQMLAALTPADGNGQGGVKDVFSGVV